MPTVLLIRHGRSTANSAGTLAGRAPGVCLDDIGRQQALDLSKRLVDIPVAAVVSSPLSRCRETAELVFPGTSVTFDERVTECDYGRWTGSSLTSLVREPLWKAVQSTPTDVTFPGGESMRSMFSRVAAAVREIDAQVLAEHGRWAVWALLSHADPIKSIVASVTGLPTDCFQRLVVYPASVSVIHLHQEQSALIALNSLSGSLEDFVPEAPVAKPGGGDGSSGRRTA